MVINYQKVIGALLLVVLISSVAYVTFDKAKIRVDDDKTTFYVLNENSRWVVSGREYNKLYDGSSLMYRSSSEINVTTETNGNEITIQRYTPYIRGPVIVDTYLFKGDVEDIELFPYSHTVEIYNASGKFYRYEVRDLVYDGPSIKLTSQTSYEFGLNMKVEWQSDYRWAWVYKAGILKVQYDILSDYEIYSVRLFDPEKQTFNNSLATEDLNFTGVENITRYLEIPINANITNATLDIQGKTNATPTEYGGGEDGEVIFTADTKSFGNLVNVTDYTNTSTTLTLYVNRDYNFTSFTLGEGMTLTTSNTSGSVLFLRATGEIVLNGTVSLASKLTSDSGITLDGTAYSWPGVATGGVGGLGGHADGGSGASGSNGGTGGAQGSGYGGGGGGGASYAYAGDADDEAEAGGGNGGPGGPAITGGTRGQVLDGDPSPADGVAPDNAAGSGGGGGGVAAADPTNIEDNHYGGTGSGTHGAVGGQPTDVGNSCGGGVEDEACGGGGGGGAGNAPGNSGVNFVLKSATITIKGTIQLAGGSGQNAGAGAVGRCDRDSGDTPENGCAGGGGAGGGGGGGGNAGTFELLFSSIDNSTGSYALNGGSAGSGGAGGAGADLGDGSGGGSTVGSAGASGSSATIGSVGSSNYTQSEEGYPESPILYIGSTNVWNYTGNYTGTETTSDFKTTLNDALNGGQCDCVGCNLVGTTCAIPFIFHAESEGILEYSSINVTYSEDVPIVELISPDDDAYLSENNQTLICNTSSTGGANLTNVSLYIDGSLNTTLNITGNTTYLFSNSFNFSDANHYWTCEAYDTDGFSLTAADRNFTIDTLYPTIDYELPTAINDTLLFQDYIEINVSVTETNEKNITYYLSNSTSSNINITTYTDSTRYLNFSSLYDDIFTYSVTVCDDTNRCNSTDLRTLELKTTELSINISLSTGLTEFAIRPDNMTGIFQPTGQNATFGVFTIYSNISLPTLQIIGKVNQTSTMITGYMNDVYNFTSAIELTDSYRVINSSWGNATEGYIWYWAEYVDARQKWFPTIDINGAEI